MGVASVLAAIVAGLFLILNTYIGITSTRRLAKEQAARASAEKERDRDKDALDGYRQLVKDQRDELARVRALLRERENRWLKSTE